MSSSCSTRSQSDSDALASMSILVAGCCLDRMGRLPTGADRSFQYLLIRLLLGSASVSKGGSKCRQNIDFSSLPAVPQSKSGAAAVEDFLASYSVGGNVRKLITTTAADNREFYKEILSEFTHYFIQSARGNHAGAFVYLYRVLERLAYSVPLLYASTQRDYMGTFNDLKSILHSDKSGEIGLFKKLLRGRGFIDPLKLQVAQTITFRSSGGHQASYFQLTVSQFGDFSAQDATRASVEIVFENILEFMVTIRNRFFHSRTGDGQKNISTLAMIDPDEYFSCINKFCASFLAVVVLQTIATKYRS